MSDQIKSGDLTREEWREYRFTDEAGKPVVHRVEGPETLFMRTGGTTHRVLDAAGLVHVVPAPGFKGCILVYKPRDKADPVQF